MYSQAAAGNESAGSFIRRVTPDRRPSAGGPQALVIDATRKLVEASAGAHALLADGAILQSSFGRLAAATRTVADALAGAIAASLATGFAETVFEGGGQRFDAEFFAVRSASDEDTHIIVMLRPQRDEARRRLDAAGAAFGLTQAESRVLNALFQGCSVPQAADRLGVAPSTARTHLQRVFDKTGVRRQGDLMRLLASG